MNTFTPKNPGTIPWKYKEVLIKLQSWLRKFAGNMRKNEKQNNT